MPHCDEETLSLLALGEGVAFPADAQAAAEHLAGCTQCRAELESLRSIVTAARQESDANGPSGLNGAGPSSVLTPPSRVWHVIAQATGVRTAPREDEVRRHAGLATDLADRPSPSPGPSTRPLSVTRRPPARPGPADRRLAGGRLPLRLLAVAASFLLVGLAAGIGGTWAVLEHGNRRPAPQVLAETDLSGLALAPAAAGTADVVETTQGRQLDLDVQRLAAPNGFYEVWLIDRSVTKMVAVGVLSGSQGRFTLPAGVDLSRYPLVDISIQPLNGDPKHSGRSVLRGTLKT